MKAGTPFLAGEMKHLKRGRPKLVVHRNELSSSHRFSVFKKKIYFFEVKLKIKILIDLRKK